MYSIFRGLIGLIGLIGLVGLIGFDWVGRVGRVDGFLRLKGVSWRCMGSS